MLISAAVVIVLLGMFKAMEVLDMIPDDWFRGLRTACAVGLAAGVLLFPNQFRDAVSTYAAEKADEFQEWFKDLLVRTAPANDTPPDDTSGNTTP